MLAALLCAALCTLSQDPAVLLVRVLDVSDARMGGDAILVTDSAAGRARHVLIDASDRGRTVVARLAAFRVDTLAPAEGGDEVNNCSVGVRLTRGDFRMLFPGDAEQQELGWWMATAPGLLRADVLTAGHHGSDNSTSADVLDVVQPRAVIISANGRQHPFADVLALLDARGIPTYCTADAGTVTVRVPRGRQWTITTQRQGTCHARTVLH